MKTSWFTFPVEIKSVDWPWSSKFPQEEVFSLLNDFFRYPVNFDIQYEFHEVTRPDYGLVRSIKVVAPKFSENRKKTDIYAIRVFQKSLLDEKIHNVVDLAKYHQRRITKLINSLESYYPKTIFLESQKYVVVLQPFLFSPVCDFSLSSDIFNLFKLIFHSSKARILLDYNHNHFLRDNGENLYYVDSDYMGNNYPDEQSALEANLNQAMVFINSENAKFIPSQLHSLSKQSNSLQEFSKSVTRAIKSFVLLCNEDKDNLSPKLLAKIQSIEVAFQKFDN
jgi:hypothetical protein